MAQTNTSLSMFAAACGDVAVRVIVTPIVNHLASKGINVSVEELVSVLQLPRNDLTAGGVAAMAFGGVAPPISGGGGSSKSRTSTASEKPIPGGCIYAYKRGENKGKVCNKAVEPGSQYCKQCGKRKNIQKDGAAGGVAPALGAIPGAAPGYGAPQYPPAQQDAPGKLSVKIWDQERNLYIEPTTNFIVTTLEGGGVTVVGVLVGNEIMPLSEDQKRVAANKQLMVRDTIQVPKPAAPTIPGFTAVNPTVPTIPSIPMMP